MDLADEALREQISALERVMAMSRRFNRDNLPSNVEEGLFLGSLKAARNKEELKKLNITHILTVANYIKPLYPNEFFYKVINGKNLLHKQSLMVVLDSQDADIKQYFDECCDFIDEAKRSGGAVLVHCIVGKSRSVTIVVAYLMKKHGMSLSQALEHVKNKRPIASPNSGFISQLDDFEKSLLANKEEKTT